MLEVKHGRGYVYVIQYHIVWCVKYRYKLLVENIEKDLKIIINQLATANDITIVEMESDKDYIHLLVECTPQHYILNLLKSLKGVSARRMFQLHPELKNSLCGGHIWNPSYFVATV
ncbi:IS200/IS605 family transposase [Clostridium cylindrosporum]|uniref:Transposase n=1 Tax=Clostridium cylindrosporum DSM 605 TaxID=1121307 RepID=A0A0J8DAN8_CLOCY|nr:IS200/IS605 family transposase [Clostridium cylindrosporum]KMT22912.1 transposase [Clostridium cylindrosporum DSM 605]